MSDALPPLSTAKPGFFARDRNFTRLLFLFVILFVIFSLLRPDMFLRWSNFQSMMKQFPEFGLMALGVAVTMITGGIDLSIVNIANLSAVIAAKFMLAYAPRGTPTTQAIITIAAAILIALAVGALCGALNGLLVAKIGIPAILATLGTQQLYMGIAIVSTGGRPVSGLPTLYSRYGSMSVWGRSIPVVLLVFVFCAAVVAIVLSRTRFGAKLYMLGANPKAAVFAGLKNARLLIMTYMMSGLLGATAGLVMMARSNSAKADYGVSYTMQSILLAVLGGVSPTGGKGTVGGVVMAILVLQLISSALNMFENVSNFYRDILWGVVMIGVLVANHYLAKRETRRQAAAK